ncbi:MAG: hypothetical protein RLZZ597_3085 [Cyanobacteriota bacterium]|jgi:spermidine/putrescine transport system substrate-binding protein
MPPLRSSRRRFLQVSAAAASTIALSNCRQRLQAPLADGSPTTSGPNDPLHLFTWSDYGDDEVFNRFTASTGIQVEVQTYDSNETMLTKMQSGGGQQFSVLYPSDYMVQQMVELGMLAALDHDRLTGLQDLREPWQNPAYDPNNTHSVPFSWGTTGLIYDTTRINPGPTDWDFWWDQQDTLAGKITLLDDVRETLGATLKALGHSYNTTNPDHIAAAFERLQTLKPAIAAFQSFGWENQLIAGDLDLCMTYSHLGNALPLEYPNLRYVIPQSGSSLWTDTMVIPKSAPNPDAAYAWINFMMAPENAAFAVERLGFATPSNATFDQLPAELQSRKTLFPPDDVLANCEGIAPLDAATTELFDRAWTELTSA